MWYLESGLLGDSGFGRVQKELLKAAGIFDCYIGERTEITKYTSGPVIRRLCRFREYDNEGGRNVFHFPYNFIPEQCCAGVAIVTIHDIIPLRYRTYDNDSEYEEYKRNIIWTVRRADYILTVSEASKNDIQDYFGIEEKQITVIHDSINEYFHRLDEGRISTFKDSFTEISGKRIILTMANRYLYKNLHKTLEAFAMLWDRNVVLVVAGNLKERETHYLKKTKELEIEKSVIFIGNIPDEELRLWYNAADIFVFPSLMEGFGLPPMEAMACGTPVITSNVSSLPEVVGDAAILVNPNDEKEIAMAMRKLLEDGQTREKLIAAGYERVKLFSGKKYRERMRRFYAEIAEDIRNDGIPVRDFSGYTVKKDEKEKSIYKFSMLFDIAAYWLELKNKNISVSEYFLLRNYRKIAIYGMGKLSKLLAEELSGSGIEILYGIDCSIRGTVCGIEVYDSDEIGALESPDVYVVTTPYIFDEIEAMLLEKLGQEKTAIIGMDEVVFDYSI